MHQLHETNCLGKGNWQDERERDENEGGVEQDVEVVKIEINQCKASEQLPQGKRESSSR